ncbi:hypothetical protein [Streptomyces sp. DSM 15324]|uniref:hypothetical protein n=1 Tax=Streptomyces sp. DSM 15324 TaxID=1739111 RepID=UPI000746E724|nr:hypothetical protein [Streptomyces sp. DSM 15324]KUO11806.1 hypothetical protein AQJ58_11615 [Streptomyces sp. DSM 15324]
MISSAHAATLVALGVLAVLVSVLIAAAAGAAAAFLARRAGEATPAALLSGGKAFIRILTLATAVLLAVAGWVASR